MNEIEVPLKITGIGAIKKELRELKGEIANATDSESIAKLSQRAGQLKDQLADANEQVNIFASGSKFEQVSNNIGSIKDSLMSLDFEEAAGKAKLLTTTLKGINPAEFAAQFKGFGQVMLSLGSAVGVVMKQFIAFGVSLLANPIFLLVAVITAVVAVILIWLNKMGLLKKAIDFIMKPINDLIAGFKELTDWLGLTSYAAEENAARTLAANEKLMQSSKERQETVVSGYDYEIRMAKIYGKETLDLELAKSKAIGTFSKQKLKDTEKALKDQLALGDNADKETVKKLKERIKEEEKIIKDQRRERNALVAQDIVNKREQAAKELEEDKKNAEARRKAAIDAAKKAADDAKKFASDRLAAQRTIKDIEIALIKNDADREIVATQEKYARLIEDTQKNENLTKDEKIKLKKLYQQQLEFELGKQEQVEIDAEKEKQKKLLDEYNNGLIKQYELQDKQALQLQELQAKTADELIQLEKDKRAIQFDAEITAAGENQELIKALTLKYQSDLTAIDKKAADEKVKIEKDKNDKIRAENFKTAKDALDTAQASLDGIQALSDINFNAKMSKLKKGSKEEEAYAKKQFQLNKALQLSTAVINGAQSILAITSVPDFTLGVATAIRIASQAAITAGTIAKIASTQFTPTGGGGGGGSQPTIPQPSSTSTTNATPAFNLFGQGNNINNVGPDGQTQTTEITVNAVVSETELTNTQNKIAKINQNATL